MDLKEKLISNYIDRSKVSSRINEIRKKALDNVEAKGFPTKILEAWKYTSLRPVLREDYSLFPSSKTLTEAEIKEFIIDQLDSYLLVFIDGVFVEKLSHTTEDTIKVISLADAFNSDKYKSLIDAHYNTAVPKGDSLSS